MPTNEEGEFELILGNRQLLSVFFVIILLLLVFFSMGYFVGRNTAPTVASIPTVQAPAASRKPIVVDPATGGTTATAAAVSPDKPSPAPTRPEPVETAVTKPAVAPPQQPKPEPVETAQARPPATPPPKPSEVRPATPPPARPPEAATPSPGRYWQILATTEKEGRDKAAGLSAKGYKVVLTPVPGQDLVRVLVGPYHDPAQLNAAREELSGLGYKPFPRKY